jgi:Fe-S-cluster containining protein
MDWEIHACSRCARCCSAAFATADELGPLMAAVDEIPDFLEKKGTSAKEVKRYLRTWRTFAGRLKFLPMDSKERCIFLDYSKKPYSCAVYASRPKICRTAPINFASLPDVDIIIVHERCPSKKAAVKDFLRQRGGSKPYKVFTVPLSEAAKKELVRLSGLSYNPVWQDHYSQMVGELDRKVLRIG